MLHNGVTMITSTKGKTKMNNVLKTAFESLTKEQQEKVMIAYMKNPEQAFDAIWESLQNNAA